MITLVTLAKMRKQYDTCISFLASSSSLFLMVIKYKSVRLPQVGDGVLCHNFCGALSAQSRLMRQMHMKISNLVSSTRNQLLLSQAKGRASQKCAMLTEVAFGPGAG